MYQNIPGAGGKRFEIIEIFAPEMGNSFIYSVPQLFPAAKS